MSGNNISSGTNKDPRYDGCFLAFLQGQSLRQIAKRFKISRNQLIRWKREKDWTSQLQQPGALTFNTVGVKTLLRQRLATELSDPNAKIQKWMIDAIVSVIEDETASTSESCPKHRQKLTCASCYFEGSEDGFIDSELLRLRSLFTDDLQDKPAQIPAWVEQQANETEVEPPTLENDPNDPLADSWINKIKRKFDLNDGTEKDKI